MKNIEELTKKLIAFRDARDWKQFHKPKDLAVSLSLEAAEGSEHFQWKNEKEIAETCFSTYYLTNLENASQIFFLFCVPYRLNIPMSSLKVASSFPTKF